LVGTGAGEVVAPVVVTVELEAVEVTAAPVRVVVTRAAMAARERWGSLGPRADRVVSAEPVREEHSPI
jgi:hypothetical protein